MKLPPRSGRPPEGLLRNEQERMAAEAYVRIFEGSRDPLHARLTTFPKYIRRQDMTRLLACYEIFKQALPVKGSVVDCGVFRGFTLMAWAHFSAILEPNNLTRRIYGFDSFTGFPRVSRKDLNVHRPAVRGELSANSHAELQEIIRAYDMNRFLGHIPKVHLVHGDACKTIPAFVRRNPHLTISLLFLDFDLYEPTRVALKYLVPRMPRGAVLAFDELDNPIWPGETRAVLDTIGMANLRIQRLPWDPYIGYAVLE